MASLGHEGLKIAWSAITWANVDSDLYHHMAWLGHNYMNPGYFTLAATDLKPQNAHVSAHFR